MGNISNNPKGKMDKYLGMYREDDNALGSGIVMIKGVEENPQNLDIRFRVNNSFVYLERYNEGSWTILGSWGGSFETDKIYLNSSEGVKGIFDNTDAFQHINYIRTTSKKGGVDVGDQNITLYLTGKNANSILISYPGASFSQNVVTSIATVLPVGTYTKTFVWNNPTSEFVTFTGYVEVPSKGRLIIAETVSGNVIWESMTEAEYVATGGNSSIEALRDIDGNITVYKTLGYVNVAVNPTAYLYQGVSYTATLQVNEGSNLGDATFPYFVINGLESISKTIATNEYVDTQVLRSYFSAVNTSDIQITQTQQILKVPLITASNNIVYDNTTGELTINKAGFYDFNMTLNIDALSTGVILEVWVQQFTNSVWVNIPTSGFTQEFSNIREPKAIYLLKTQLEQGNKYRIMAKSNSNTNLYARKTTLTNAVIMPSVRVGISN